MRFGDQGVDLGELRNMMRRDLAGEASLLGMVLA
jgi:hypothetical protein